MARRRRIVELTIGLLLVAACAALAAGSITGIASPSVVSPEINGDLQQIKRDLHQQVIGALDLAAIGTMREDELRSEVRRIAEQLSRHRTDLLSQNEKEMLVTQKIINKDQLVVFDFLA